MLILEVSRVPDFPFEYRNLGRHTSEHRVAVTDSQQTSQCNASGRGELSEEAKKKKVGRERKTVFDASGRREKSCLGCSVVMA